MSLKIISGSASKSLSKEVCRILDITPVKTTTRIFADGEIGIQIDENVRGCDIFVIQSTSTPVNDNLMELLLMIDALKRASVKRITAVIPYFGYSRQDRKTKPRVPISAALVAEIIETAGANRVLSVDLHCGQIQGFFRIPVDNLYSAPVLYSKIVRGESLSLATISSTASAAASTCSSVSEIVFDDDESSADLSPTIRITGDGSGDGSNTSATSPPRRIIVVSPDAGGAERADQFRNGLERIGLRGVGMGMMNKQRIEANMVYTMELVGNVQDADVIIVDDMVDTGGTLCTAAKVLKDHGASRIVACVTHPILSANAIERIENSDVEQLVVTNTIYLPENIRSSKIVQVSVGNLIAEAIRRVHNEESLHALFHMNA